MQNSNATKKYRLLKDIQFPHGRSIAGTIGEKEGDYYYFPYVGKSYNDGHSGWLGNAYLIMNPEDYPDFFEEVKEPEYGKDAYQRLFEQNQALMKELSVTDELLKERQKLLDAIPECAPHGKCVPHALEWIEKMKSLHPTPPTTDTPIHKEEDKG